MSLLSRTLRRQLTGQFPQGNPLAIIGVSPQILELGLTDDELFDYITKDIARRLVMRFHPDRIADNRPDIELLQRKYAEAYELLQDRETFDKALAEFIQTRGEQRSDYELMRRTLREKDQQLKLTLMQKDKALAEASPKNRKLEVVTEAFYRRIQAATIRFSQLLGSDPRILPVEQVSGVVVLIFDYDSGRRLPLVKTREELKDIYEALVTTADNLNIEPWKQTLGTHSDLNEGQKKLVQEWNDLESQLRLSGMDGVNSMSLINAALDDENILFPQINWTDRNSFGKYGFSLMGGNIHSRTSFWQDDLANMPQEVKISILSQRYWEAFEWLAKNLFTSRISIIKSLRIRVRYLPVKNGYLKDNFGNFERQTRITGSILTSDFDPASYRDGNLDSSIIPQVHPFIAEGHLMVTQGLETIRYPRVAMTHNKINQLYDYMRKKSPLFRSRHIVIHAFQDNEKS